MPNITTTYNSTTTDYNLATESYGSGTYLDLQAVLQTGNIIIYPKLYLLDSDNNLLREITQYLSGGTIEYDADRRMRITARLTLSADANIDYNNQRVRIAVIISTDDNRWQYTYNMGIYLLNAPTRTLATSADVDVECVSTLGVVDTVVGQTFTLASGSNYVTQISNILTTTLGEPAAYVNIPSNAATLPYAMVWELDETTTYLDIINSLLTAIAYEELYVDRDGVFRSTPRVLPNQLAIIGTYSADSSNTVVAIDRQVETNYFDAPNRWVFYIANAKAGLPIVGDGLYVVLNQSDGPTSIDARGRTISKVIPLDAADHASLVSTANAIVAEEKRASETVKIGLSPNPEAWFRPAVSYTDNFLGTTKIYEVARWTFDLNGSDTTYEMRLV